MALDLPQYQVQILIALGTLGVYVGWRGGMQNMAGFYDMPNATKHLAFGIVLGAFSGILIDGLFISLVAQTGAVLIETLGLMIFVGLAQSLIFHFILSREKVRLLLASPTSGWTMGLGMGALQASYLMIRMADPNWIGFVSGFNWPMILTGVWITITLPAIEAALGSWQGAAVVDKKPLTVMWQSGLYRGFVLIAVLVGITAQPILLLVLPVVAIYGFSVAEEKWLPSALIPSIRQEYYRTVRKSSERARLKAERQHGDIVNESEE